MKKKPVELQIGDRFRLRGGPYAGLTAEVIGYPQAGRWAMFSVPVRILTEVTAKLNFDDEVEVIVRVEAPVEVADGE